ncbi:MAG: ABC transporter ATP-binding protein [Anaerolineae bacterium]
MDVKITQLVKDYGKFRALESVSLNIGSGMFGLLGPNGAGKTTLMKIITTLLRPTSGQVMVNGWDVMRDPHHIRQNLGYLPQEFGFYKGLNAYELLDYVGTMKNLSRIERREQVERVLEQVNLTKDAKRKVGKFSGGMKQRLGIAQALIGNPTLLVVDEPTAGLDPEERIRFRNLLARISGQRTVILSTHIVADIEAVCNQVAVLNRGSLIFTGTPADLIAGASSKVWEIEIDPAEYERVEEQYTIISSRAADHRMVLRLIAYENPFGRGALVQPGLEDGYVAVMVHTKAQKAVAYA